MASTPGTRTSVRPDDLFFPFMALLILAVVFYGFAQSYFLAGMLRAKLPNLLVHIHGALFVSWIFLLVLQNALVTVDRVRWHMTFGWLSVLLVPLMVVFGILTVFDSIRRNGTGIPAEIILVGDFEELFCFAGLTLWGILQRRVPVSHKRLMILGTLAMTGPAINRWPFPDAIRLPATLVIYVGLPLLVVAYDLWRLRRVHRTTLIGTSPHRHSRRIAPLRRQLDRLATRRRLDPPRLDPPFVSIPLIQRISIPRQARNPYFFGTYKNSGCPLAGPHGPENS